MNLQFIKNHEGLKLKAYRCTSGKLTIGYGFNLDDNEIPKYIADELFSFVIGNVMSEININLPLYNNLNDSRKMVLLDMVFNLGMPRFLNFKKMLKALEIGDFDRAADEMLDSRWALQVPNRAKEDAEIMRNGSYDNN